MAVPVVLLDLTSYVVLVGTTVTRLLVAVFWRVIGLVIAVLGVCSETVPTLEAVYRSARWLEREVTELTCVSFSRKRDRRSLFLVPFLYWGVLLPQFPVDGLTEVRLDP